MPHNDLRLFSSAQEYKCRSVSARSRNDLQRCFSSVSFCIPLRPDKSKRAFLVSIAAWLQAKTVYTLLSGLSMSFAQAPQTWMLPAFSYILDRTALQIQPCARREIGQIYRAICARSRWRKGTSAGVLLLAARISPPSRSSSVALW